ncbi:hypothetical protein S1OALGB6SA_454 [Olavius algarvensis spirochete endosymbiont]|nr:hypothetical protein S1OALGB6SA_454 [Olavius algarvensis spirochete endosymbiont]
MLIMVNSIRDIVNPNRVFMEIFLVASRFKKVRMALKKTQKEFAGLLGTVQGVVSDIENGRKQLSRTLIVGVVQQFRIDATWLLTGEGSMFRSDAQQNERHQTGDDFRKSLPDVYNLYKDYQRIKEEKKDNRGCSLCDTINQLDFRRTTKVEGFALSQLDEQREEGQKLPSRSDEVSEPEEEYGPRIALPLYESVAAGKPLESFDAGESFSVFLSRLQGHPDEYFAVRVRGSSMTEAGIPDDAIVVMRKEQDLINGKIYLFRHEGEYTLKRYYLGKDGKPRLAYDDGSGREMEMREGEGWEVVGLFCFVG